MSSANTDALREPSEWRVNERARANYEREHPDRAWSTFEPRVPGAATPVMASEAERADYLAIAREVLLTDDNAP